MPTPAEQLAALGLVLPTPPKAVAAYVPCVRVGHLLFVSGQLPFKDGVLMGLGPVPASVDLPTAQACARQCALNLLAIAAGAAGGIHRLKRVVRLGVFVCCEAGFTQQPQVANGASELMEQVFGEAGRHARAAVGSISLPLGACVEVEGIFEMSEDVSTEKS